MRLAYNGAGYHGWQVQPNGTTVQECVERALSTVLRTPVAVTGAGRTDAGVNAAMMVAHFDVEVPIADSAALMRQLNSILGRDIAVYAIYRVADDAHARFDATSRTYKYFVTMEKSPFSYPFPWHCRTPRDCANCSPTLPPTTAAAPTPVGSKPTTEGGYSPSQPTAFCATWCVPLWVRLWRWGSTASQWRSFARLLRRKTAARQAPPCLAMRCFCGR